MTSLPGTWALTMRTPIGSINATMTFTDTDGVLTGTAAGAAETVPLQNLRTAISPAGETVTWSQSITKPIRLNLDFEVLVTGDTMQGHSRAGRLPKSSVEGTRQAA
ncbi:MULTISPECIES: hypothetical protein [unclassified Arthrobacter]|uniref:hypothetical protein n=1 Tax=unclassified Arthrobacter TaxID=235627 RepID=UPI001E38367E|nr:MULTISPECIES: hypothetical protein [unclassified Arthrobacter]MCC9146782.1 hypothetical protein [Arthrobacter sp. zg-Y919]MDK1278013.1 hypothetical protein [Arthrobacter sp. zg.Y919]WIB03397.1 hypothetical protein QNO10_01510 [Arthrobacter sp. zg-Y919]